VRFLSAVIEWSLRNRPVVLLASVLLLAAGLVSATRLPLDAVPDVTSNQVQIITSAPALSPVEIEQYVTVPVERAMAGIPRVTELRSVSKYGISVVTVVFTDDTDLYFARQLVLERMGDAEAAIPAGYGKPRMGPISTGLGEVYQFVVRGDGKSLMELEETLDWYIGPQLRSVPGVVEVNSMGGEDKQYQVIVDPGRLQAAGLSLAEVARAIEQTNANAGGGYIERNREQLVIGTDGLVRGLEDLRSVVVGATGQGIPITVGTVGDVRFGPRLRRGASSMNGKGEVVVGVTLMLMGENARTVTERVKARLAALEPTLPPGTAIEPFYDRAALVDRIIHTVSANLAEGAALVIVVLLLLLGDVRAGLIVALTIPLSMLFALILMAATGASGNLMSLGAIDFGLIVDGAVIIVDNAVRRLGERRRDKGAPLSPAERTDTVRVAALEVRRASVFGEVIIAIVYIPVLALQGIEGKIFAPMARTVLFALMGAFVLSLTLVPVLASYWLTPHVEERETWLMRRFEALYRPVLGGALRFRWAVVGGATLAIAASVALFLHIGAEFVPQLDEGDLLIEVRRLPGVALSESIATDRRIQRALLTIPEVAQVVSKTGSPELATDSMGIEQTDVYIQLKPPDQWRRGLSKDALTEEISETLEREVPEVSGALSQPIEMRTNELLAGARSDVVLQIYGPDLEALQRLGDRAATILHEVPGAQDVRAVQGAGLGYIRIRPDRARLARYGLTVGDVNILAEAIATGRQAGVVFEGDRRFDMVVKVDLPPEAGVEAFRNLPLKAATGQMVPLGDVADVLVQKGPAVIERDQQSRRLPVELNVRGRDMVSVVADAQAALAAQLQVPPGYRLEWAGQFQSYESARRRLSIVIPAVFSLILFLLWMAFRAVRPALLIFLNVPFAVVGGVLALWLRDIPFSISAAVGFIALFGVAVLNGLVMLSYARHLEEDGVPADEAIRLASERRLRPVLMTALVAALGFFPMALSTAPGSEVQRPLATVVIGGLFTASTLTLLVLPAVYQITRRRRAEEPRPASPGAAP
jgi:cobalt-zinc-cadmium resistance protein CzcA